MNNETPTYRRATAEGQVAVDPARGCFGLVGDWRDEHEGLIRDLERAVGQGRMPDAGQILGQLKAMHDKRFGALPRVIEALADEDAM